MKWWGVAAYLICSLVLTVNSVSGQEKTPEGDGLPVEIIDATLAPVVVTVIPQERGLSVAEPEIFLSAVLGQVETETKGGTLLDAAEQDVQTVWEQIVKREYQYKDMTGGQYFQGLPTSSETPRDGGAVAMDRWYNHPTDQSYSWDEIKVLPFSELPFTFRIDVYDGPQGRGFVGRFEMVIDGQLYTRSINEGPETWTEAAWTAVKQ